jgi:TonB family protein
MPKNPTELMQLAIRLNGLSAPEIKPWHLRASYQTFDNDGKPKDQGIFEAWWAAPEQYKFRFASSGFTQTEYRVKMNTYLVGEQKWPSFPESILPQELFGPLNLFRGVDSPKFSSTEVKSGDVKLDCLRLVPKNPLPPTVQLPAYCFGRDIPAIRIVAQFGQTITFNDIVRFQGQYLARRIRLIKEKLPVLNIDVTGLDASPEITDGELTPPPDALLAPARRVAVSGGVIAGNRIGGQDPEYPAYAKDNRIQGRVIIAITITKDGQPTDLQVIGGPKELQQAALNAVKTWRYKPYLLNGEPVEVKTQVNLDFHLTN